MSNLDELAIKVKVINNLEDIAETFRGDPDYEDWVWACKWAIDCILKDKGRRNNEHVD